MKVIKYISLMLLLLFGVVIVSCQKDDYIIGGSLHNPKVNVSTYDYLKTKPLFDTLMILVDKAGLKDKLNSDITFFAPTDYAVVNYMNNRRSEGRKTNGVYNYTLDTLIKYDLPAFRDSLQMYMVQGKIIREDMTPKKAYLKQSLLGNQVGYALVEFTQGGPVMTNPLIMAYINVVNTPDFDQPNPDEITDDERDMINIVQTSGIQTTTGVIHVLDNSHLLFYRK